MERFQFQVFHATFQAILATQKDEIRPLKYICVGFHSHFSYIQLKKLI